MVKLNFPVKIKLKRDSQLELLKSDFTKDHVLKIPEVYPLLSDFIFAGVSFSIIFNFNYDLDLQVEVNQTLKNNIDSTNS